MIINATSPPWARRYTSNINTEGLIALIINNRTNVNNTDNDTANPTASNHISNTSTTNSTSNVNIDPTNHQLNNIVRLRKKARCPAAGTFADSDSLPAAVQWVEQVGRCACAGLCAHAYVYIYIYIYFCLLLLLLLLPLLLLIIIIIIVVYIYI